MKIENKQGIDFIVMRPKAHCYCPLGADWYTNEFEISMTPDKYFPDYCDVEAFLDKISPLSHVHVAGLMTSAPYVTNPDDQRKKPHY